MHNEIETVIAQKKILIQDSTLFNERRGNLQARRKKLADKDLKIEFKDIIEDDSFLQKNVEKYWLDACNADNFHKIMDKNDFETILQGVLQPLELNFRVVEDSLSNFDELFAELTNATMPRAYNEIYNLTR